MIDLMNELRRILNELARQGATASAFVTDEDGVSVELTGRVDHRRQACQAEAISLH